MRKLLITALWLLPLAAISQKLDLDRFKFTAEYRSLPQVLLDSSYHTYNVSVEASKLMKGYLRDLSPDQSVIIEGWKMLPQDGHLSVSVTMEDLLPESVSVKQRAEAIFDKSGKQTGTRTLYSQEVIYTFSAFADVSDFKGAHIKNFILADRGYKQVYSSPEFPIRQMAEGYFVLNTVSLTEKLYKSCVTRAMHYLSEQLNNDFGYGKATVTDNMWIIDTKKHPEYTAHRNAFLTIKEVMFDLSADKPLNEAREQLKPAITYFESIKKKYTSSSKHDRKIRYASYYNLAVLYYYLDDPQAMLKEASGLILNDFDARDGKNFETTAIWLKNLFDETKIYTRHFTIDTTRFNGPRGTSVIAVK